ncbi:cytochrome c biogenesis protein CcdA [Clostridium sp.]|jgi:cytochrome c-type biogenesis protein|uniref:redoxin domain-containing protein n=1 Tax=Clostridium sp. TaxID=1506 RepID=UPI003A5BB330
MEHISVFLVFVEGVLSLFSPCIIPLLPVYLSVLSGSNYNDLKSGKNEEQNRNLFKNTVLFLLGISTTFFILGSSASVLNYFLRSNKKIILIIGGIVVVIMGISYMGYLKIPFLQREKKFNIEINKMNPLKAYVLGFVFSFGWTPCVGPMLSSVLIMASTSKSIFIGNMLILVYTAGFMIPFIIITAFYKKLLRLLDKIKFHMNVIEKIGGIILLITGLVMILSGAGFKINNINNSESYANEQNEQFENNKDDSNTEDDESEAPNFELVDQYGNTHNLSDYRGKVVFLNFWATWCPPCRAELPNIEKVYKEYKNNTKDVIILGVVAPNLGREGSREDIKKFLKENGYTFPVLFDDGSIMYKYGIGAFPTTFIIDKNGRIYEGISGGLEKTMMESLIDKAK